MALAGPLRRPKVSHRVIVCVNYVRVNFGPETISYGEKEEKRGERVKLASYCPEDKESLIIISRDWNKVNVPS